MAEIHTETVQKRIIPKNMLLPAGIGALLVLTMAITMIVATAGRTIREGVSVAGIAVGRMDKAAAAELLNQKVAKMIQENVITIDYEGKTENITFNEFLTGYKVDEALEKAYSLGRSSNPFGNTVQSLSLRVHKINVPLEPMMDESFLTQFMDEYAGKLDTPIEENVYRLDGSRLRLRNGKKGFAIDKQKAVEDIKNVLMSGENGYVTVLKGEKEPQPFDVNKIYEEICTPPVDAKYEMQNGRGFLVKAKNGYNFNKDDLTALIEKNKENTKAYYLSLEIIEPKVKTVNTDDLFGELLGEYTSKITDSNANRLNNVRLAASRINGVVLNPDEIFYYLSHVEPITEAGGYKIANVYNNGKIEQDIGGGVCQVSSALYSAVLYANLDVIRRYNHSLTVGYVPYGQDATVSSGDIDFRFKNDTNAPLKVTTSVDGSGVHIRIFGEKPDKDISVKIENVTVQTNPPKVVVTDDPSLPAGKIVTDTNGKTGYVVETYKNIYRNGDFVERLFVSKSVYKTLDTVQRRGTGAPAQEEPSVSQPKPAVQETPAAAVTAKPTEPVAEVQMPKPIFTPSVPEESPDA